MMRFQIVAVAGIFAIGCAGVSSAAEISEQGARELRNNLTHALSHDLARSGFVHVKPLDNAYEVTFDIEEFLDKVSSADFAITGLKPLTLLVAPLQGGLWSIDENSDGFNVSVHSRLGRGPATDMDYSLGAYSYRGVFDPSISYLRSGIFTAKAFKASTVTGGQATELGAAGINSTLSTVDSGEAHKVDLHASGSMPSFYEKLTSPTTPDLDMRTDSLDVDTSMTGVPVTKVRDLLHFVFEHVKAKTLSKKGSDRFKGLLRDALPLFDHVQENVSLSNLAVSAGKGSGGVKHLNYSLGMDGVTKSTRIDLGLKAQDIALGDGIVPAAYMPLVPNAAELQVGVPNLDLADAVDVLLQADFSKAEPLSREESDKIGRILFPGDSFMVDMPKFSAVSPAYDVEVSGKLLASVKQKGHFSLQASILARDYDKSISFVQNAAKADPKLNQVSFGMMVAKGFAKTDADGRQRWDVNVAEDGSVTVNGQVMKLPAAPGASTP